VQETGTELNNSATFAVFDINKHVKQAVRMLFSTNHCSEQLTAASPSFDVSSYTYSISGASASFTKSSESDSTQGSFSVHLPADFTSETRERILVTFGTGTTVKRPLKRLKSHSINFLYNGSPYKHELRFLLHLFVASVKRMFNEKQKPILVSSLNAMLDTVDCLRYT
jgi:hypothetical protein